MKHITIGSITIRGAVTVLDDVPYSTYFRGVTPSGFYFWSYDPVTGIEPYISDGTGAGTHLVKDINSGSGNSSDIQPYAHYFTALGDKFIFIANAGGPEGYEVWVSDGSEAGTFALTGPEAQAAGGSVSWRPGVYQLHSGDCEWPDSFFQASMSGIGRELFVTDGTVVGTHLVKDINPGSNSSTPLNFYTDGDHFYFAISSGPNSDLVWVSDGTEAGTHVISDPNPAGTILNNPPQLLSTIQLDVAIPTHAVAHDLNGDGTSDILWRNDSGILTDWLMDNGQYTGSGYGYSVSTDWHVAGTGDFNGDSTSDILWRNDSGILTDWLMDNGQYTGSGYGYSVGTEWRVAGTGDFNGDGTSDILWRNDSGILTDWLMDNGQYTGSGYGYSIGTDWHVVGAGDYDGDGASDILWRNDSGILTDWLMDNGQYTGSGYGYSIGTDWHVVGTGDFNGDGTSDILWRNDSGVVTDWLMNDGQYTGSGYGYSISTDWQVAATGDYNGDGTDDILWRNDDGTVATWLMADGQYTGLGSGYSISNDWHIQA